MSDYICDYCLGQMVKPEGKTPRCEECGRDAEGHHHKLRTA